MHPAARHLRLVLLCLAALVAAERARAGGDIAAGRTVFGRCMFCHSDRPGVNMTGPSLAGVMGRVSGTEPGFDYSNAMRQAAVTWDDATLDEFLRDPGAFMRGTRMTYSLPRPRDRQDVIAYLKTLPK